MKRWLSILAVFGCIVAYLDAKMKMKRDKHILMQKFWK